MSWKFLLTCLILLFIGFSGLNVLDQRIIVVNQKIKSTEIQLNINQFHKTFNNYIENLKVNFSLLTAFKPDDITKKLLSKYFFNYIELYPSLNAFYLTQDNTIEYSIFSNYEYKITDFSPEQKTTLLPDIKKALKNKEVVITKPLKFINNESNYIFFVIPIQSKKNNKVLLALLNLNTLIDKHIDTISHLEDIDVTIKTSSNKLIYGSIHDDSPGDIIIEGFNTPLGEWKFEILIKNSTQFQYLRKLIWILGFSLMAFLVFYMLIIDRKNQAITTNYQELKETELLLKFHYEREKVLREIIQKIHSTKDIDELLQYICNTLGAFLNLDHVSYLEVDDNITFKFEYCSPDMKHSFLGLSAPPGTIIYDYLINKQEIFISRDMNEEKRPIALEMLKAKKTYLRSTLHIPIVLNNKVLGVLGFASIKKDIWNNDLIDYIKTTISQIAIALHQNNLIVELDNTSKTILESLNQEELLKDISNTIRTSIDIKEIYSTVNNKLGKFLEVDRVFILEYDEDSKTPLPITSDYISSEEIVPLANNDEFFKEIKTFILNLPPSAKNKQHIFSKTSEFLKKYFNQPGFFSNKYNMNSFISTPIAYQNKQFATLLIGQSNNNRDWKPSEVQLLSKITEQLAIAMYQLKLYDELKNFTDKQVVINNIFQVIRSSINIDEILWNACQEIGSFLKVNRCTILLHNLENNVSEPIKYEYRSNIDLTSAHGLIADINPDNHYSFNCIIKEQRPFMIDQISKDSSVVRFINSENFINEYQIKSILMVPIVYNEVSIASIILCHSDEARRWTDSDSFFLKSIADQIAIALHQASLFNELNIANTKLTDAYKKEQTIRKILELVRSSLDLKMIYSDITREIVKSLNVSRCDIWEYDAENETFLPDIFEAKSDNTLPSIKGLSLSEEEFKLGKSIIEKEGKPFIIDNIDDFPLTKIENSLSKKLNNKSLIIFPIAYQGKPLGLFVVSQCDYYRTWQADEIEILQNVIDHASIAIAQVKMYEYVQETSRLKSEFLASVSHELKTPLNSIIVLSEVMQNKDSVKSHEEQVELLKIIHSSGEELLKHINNILDMAKVEFAKKTSKLKYFNLPELIDEIKLFLNPLTKEKNIELIIEIEENLKNEIYSDRELLKFIINNLMNNAIKFTHKGSVQLNIKQVNDSFINENNLKFNTNNHKDFIYLEVKDTGIGIDKKYHSLIFEEFRQVEDTEIRNYGGTGLGLAICKKSINLLGGQIWVNSELGIGTEFKVVIPLLK